MPFFCSAFSLSISFNGMFFFFSYSNLSICYRLALASASLYSFSSSASFFSSYYYCLVGFRIMFYEDRTKGYFHSFNFTHGQNTDFGVLEGFVFDLLGELFKFVGVLGFSGLDS